MVFAAVVLAGVTFSAPAAPASRLIPALGKVAGIPMEVAPALAREVLVIAVKGVSPTTLMTRVAEATGGEWSQKNGIYRLGLSPSVAGKDRRAEEGEREATWRRAIAQGIEQAAKRSSNDRGRSVVLTALAGLPAGTLGACGFKDRVVFSTRPTPSQRLFPASALRDVDLTSLPRVKGPVVDGVPMPPAGDATGAQLTLQTQGGGRALVASLVTADAQNRGVGGASFTLDAQPIERETSDSAVPSKPLPVSDDERRQAVALAPLDRFLSPVESIGQEPTSDAATVQYAPDELKGATVFRSVRELLDPETTEPLALTAGPLLTRYAQAEGTNLVADLPDAAFLPARAFLAQPTTIVAEVGESAPATLDLDLRTKDGWTVARPHRPTVARASRLDRSALGTALRALAKEGLPTLDAQAAYAAAQPIVAPDETFEGALFGAVDPSYGKHIATSSTSGNRLLLRLYRQFGHGTGVDARPVGALPTEARALLEALVYGSLSGPSVPLPLSAPLGGTGARRTSGERREFWSLDTERTVFWPNGIPGDAILKIVESTAPAFYGIAPNGARPRIAERGSGYSMTFTDKGPVVTATTLPKLDRYAQGSLSTVTFVLTGPPGRPRAVFRRTLAEERLDPKVPTIPYGDLPESLRKNYDDLDARLRDDAARYGAPTGTAKP